ncbi:MAG: CCA tRNA nucleotidyltransferase [Nitrospirae bacterium]|nr:CCA tRNA nucleotidyltransferase [Nitrospirota bacterium]
MAATTAQGRNLRDLMRDRLPAKIFNRLEDAGRLAQQSGVAAFVVGGLVRDLLLGRATIDVDITVEGDGMTFARRLADRHNAALKIFERFATAYVVFPDRMKFDIASTRAGQPARLVAGAEGAWSVPVGESCHIEQDLMRRDFTINALAIHLNAGRFGQLLDPCGGLRDLRGRTIRAVYDFSFTDDPTRVYRAVRFERRFGFKIERGTLRLPKEAIAKRLVHQLPGHRVKNELMLLLAEKDQARTIRRLSELDLLRPIHPTLQLTPRLKTLLAGLANALGWWGRRFPDRKPDHPLAYFMALTDRLSAPAVNALMKRLVLPEGQAEKVRTVTRRLEPILRRLGKSRPLTPSQTYRLLVGLPDEGLILLVAEAASASVKRLVSAYLTTYQPTRLAISGKNLASMGLQSGPVYKAILDRVLDAKLDGTVTTEREERELAQRLVRKIAV